MVGDAVENCLKYIDRFDPINWDNPHAYFTKIIYFAFLRRIETEKKLLEVKLEYEKSLNIYEMTVDKNPNDDDSYDSEVSHSEGTKTYVNDFLTNRQERKLNKGKKRYVNKKG